jgi:hypothetical protein
VVYSLARLSCSLKRLVLVAKRSAPEELEQDIKDLGPEFLQKALSKEIAALPDVQGAEKEHCNLFPHAQAHTFHGALTKKFLEELFLTIAHNTNDELPPVCFLKLPWFFLRCISESVV